MVSWVPPRTYESGRSSCCGGSSPPSSPPSLGCGKGPMISTERFVRWNCAPGSSKTPSRGSSRIISPSRSRIRLYSTICHTRSFPMRSSHRISWSVSRSHSAYKKSIGHSFAPSFSRRSRRDCETDGVTMTKKSRFGRRILVVSLWRSCQVRRRVAEKYSSFSQVESSLSRVPERKVTIASFSLEEWDVGELLLSSSIPWPLNDFHPSWRR
ncbi:unnamed protein product [Periconia digitata]|uniref:Uncharacterized protein n=1 Tax=Periconia digitata TaxID=1303443 RepID=A0A9W4U7A0_9PLEO|nr:unnamed protein product [Periconia digitata]